MARAEDGGRAAGGEACRPAEEGARAPAPTGGAGAAGMAGGAACAAAVRPKADTGGLDWPGLMRAGLRGLGLRPGEFWDLTPAELALMLGIDFGAAAMTRARLGDLMARFPDGAAAGGAGDPRAGPKPARMNQKDRRQADGG